MLGWRRPLLARRKEEEEAEGAEVGVGIVVGGGWISRGRDGRKDRVATIVEGGNEGAAAMDEEVI